MLLQDVLIRPGHDVAASEHLLDKSRRPVRQRRLVVLVECGGGCRATTAATARCHGQLRLGTRRVRARQVVVFE
jgi:hypothetical protein